MTVPPQAIPFEPSAAAGLALAAATALFLPPILALLWRRRTGAPLSVWGWGALVFFLSQVVLRIPWQAPLSAWLHNRWKGHEALQLLSLLFACLTAGLFEEVGRWVGYRTLLRGERSLRTGVMFGLGHGGLESMLLIGLSLAGLLVAYVLASSGKIPPGPALEAIRTQTGQLTFWLALAGGAERVSAIALHAGLSLIVLQAYTRGGARWVALAIGLHFAANALGVMAAQRLGPWPAELVIAISAACILPLGISLARGAPAQAAPAPPPPAPSP
jgi:uncharacterized membrane protein YhfC